MKKCNTELMKELKEIRKELDDVYETASVKCEVEYYEGEEEVDRSFDFEEFNNKVIELQNRQEKIRSLLEYSNATTKLVGMEELTISEGLFRLSLLSARLARLNRFKCVKQIEKSVRHASFEGDKDRVHVKEVLYDPKRIDEEMAMLQKEISKLQIVIDRTNLTNIIEC